MKLIIGGSIAVIFSMLGFDFYFPQFLKFLAGIVPVMLFLGGCLALFVYREMRCDACDAEQPETIPPRPEPVAPPGPASSPEPKTEDPEKPVPESPVPPQEVPENEPVQRVESDESEPSESGGKEGPVRPEPDREPAKISSSSEPEPAFIGNEETHVFHTRTCQFSKSKKCTQAFETKEAAQAAGYKACGVCKP